MSDTPKKMSKSEAREIRSLVKSEYAFLDQELGGQVSRVKAEIRQQMDAEADIALSNARKRTDKIRAKANKLKEEAHELLRQLQLEGFSLSGYGKSELFNFNLNDESLKVGTIEKRMKSAFETVDLQVNDARRVLKVQENEAVRKLTLNMCDTDEARQFVESIPTLAELVQMPNLTQITS